jgi:hypothetical protein
MNYEVTYVDASKWKTIITILLLILGMVFIITAAVIAYVSFYGYKVPVVQGASVEDVITSLINALVDIAVKLGFLGLTVWAGSILLKHGISLIKPETHRGEK